MIRRIKKGLAKTKKKANNPSILSPSWVGFAERNIIEKLSGRPYDEVKDAMTAAFLRQLMMKGLTISV